MRPFVTILATFSIGLLALGTNFASAQALGVCLDDQTPSHVVCTANDEEDYVVTVADVVSPCTETPDGYMAVVDLEFVIAEDNAHDRYDIGAWVAADGGDALTGDCNRRALNAGDLGAEDQDGDGCWGRGKGGTVRFLMEDVHVLCPEEGDVVVSVCLSWGQEETGAVDTDGDGLCGGDDPANPVNPEADLMAGTPSKCACQEVTLGNVPLPVELVSFSGEVSNADVVLRWATETESNNAGFAVEHAYRSRRFEQVGFVTGAGSTLEGQTYSYSLTGLNPGRHFFRLKQIDYDGSFAYSAEIEIEVGVPGKYLLESAYPNPFNPQTTINFLVPEAQPVTMELFDALGNHIRELYNDVSPANTTQTVRVDGSGLPTGVYFVRLTGSNFTGSQRIVLMK